MTSADFQFYQNQQKNPPIGYCSANVDKHWEKSVKRKEQEVTGHKMKVMQIFVILQSIKMKKTIVVI